MAIITGNKANLSVAAGAGAFTIRAAGYNRVADGFGQTGADKTFMEQKAVVAVSID
ncbi:MAG TPA: hypothetical protein VKM56_07650 [Verrucomicrobiae bacterium]|nr:hypothetical protein [Verrucomicrobiae bacterium]